MMKRLVIVLFVMIFLSGCGLNSQTYRIKDATKPETIVLTKKPGQGPVYSLTIRGKGEVRGNATISLILNGEAYKHESISGEVDFKWGGDWYSDKAEIRYEPSSVSGGELSLRHSFNSITKR